MSSVSGPEGGAGQPPNIDEEQIRLKTDPTMQYNLNQLKETVSHLEEVLKEIQQGLGKKGSSSLAQNFLNIFDELKTNLEQVKSHLQPKETISQTLDSIMKELINMQKDLTEYMKDLSAFMQSIQEHSQQVEELMHKILNAVSKLENP
ncbi:MAG: hypothetical protein HYZ47_00735 [Simkania negevensis]|nr:hypothetical protein [Simkania negevensis]